MISERNSRCRKNTIAKKIEQFLLSEDELMKYLEHDKRCFSILDNFLTLSKNQAH